MKKFYITFGQVHTHSYNGKTLDKDCVLEVWGEDEARVRTFANNTLKGVYANIYDNKPNMKYFPRGIIKAS